MAIGWRVVRRKGRTPEIPSKDRFDNPDITSFYVNNLPGDTFRKELLAPCYALGNLVDIYIAGRRDAVGFFFAFIRYEKPPNPEIIVKGLAEIVCRGRKLNANIAKRNRQAAKKQGRPQVAAQRPVINTTRRYANGGRTFADVTSGKTPTPPPPPLPPSNSSKFLR
ncbi:hypothetical protein LXL04_014908 [Taraxacum kok-saghyz]